MSADTVPPTTAPPANDSGLAKGATIGRYVVLGLLGRGGMGEVFAAYDPELDRKIAVKLLRARSGAATVEERTRLLREAQAIAKLSHPNVVVIYDVGTFRDSVFIAMEFVEGHTLGYWLEAQQRPWREVLNVYQAAGHGLEAAHAAGLVHRDFKPDNVMITKTGQVRVMDFGLARAVQRDDEPSLAKQGAFDAAARAVAIAETMDPAGDPDETAKLGAAGQSANVPEASGGYLRLKLTRTGAMLGTPAYMAPEQFAGVGGDARVDQFAFSVALYEGLYGKRPFEGSNVVALMANVVAGTITEPPDDTRVPGWIRKILLRGLSTRPNDRFASMTEMLAALSRDPGARRRRWMALVGGVGVVASIATGAHRLSAGQRAMCAGGPARAATAWGAERRGAVERAFAASGHKRAAQAFAVTAKLLDAYVARWTGMYTEACEAAQVRGEQSADVLDLRMACLGERLAGVRALGDVLTSADPGVVENAVGAAGALPTLDRCGDVPMLRAVIRAPDDPGKRAEVARLRDEVAKVSVLASAGRCDRAMLVGRPVLDAARGLRYKPLEAEISYALGRLFDTCLDTKEALGHLEDAVLDAEAARHDEIAIEASVMLAVAYADRSHEIDLSRHWIRHGEAILSRFDGHPLLEARVAVSRAVVRNAEGRFEDALQENNRGLAIQESLLGPTSLDVAMSANNVATVLHELGRDAEAAASIRRALAIFTELLGEDSGRVAISLLNEAEILTALGRFDAANGALDRALAILRRQGASPFLIGYGLLNQGKLRLAEHNPRAAVAVLEQSLALLGEQDAQKTADVRFSLAVAVLASSPAARARALDLARSAREAVASDRAAQNLARKIDAWLAAPARSAGVRLLKKQ